MTDVRALLAAERSKRRITHPHLTYTKSNALICNVCQLNVKSEALWDGHLRSANHKKNAKAAQDASTRSLKRKHEDDDEVVGPQQSRPNIKVPKSRAASLAEKQARVSFKDEVDVMPDAPISVPARPTKAAPAAFSDINGPESASATAEEEEEQVQTADTEVEPKPRKQPAPQPSSAPADTAVDVDEDEWAAFERDIAPLASGLDSDLAPAPDYAAATISAAPMTAEQLAAQQAAEKRKHAEVLAADEEDDERGRLEDELEVMEEMEERVRRLKEMREKLRAGKPQTAATMEDGEGASSSPVVNGKARNRGSEASASHPGADGSEGNNETSRDESESESDSDEDDWYR
jgi:zinc finger protein 830